MQFSYYIQVAPQVVLIDKKEKINHGEGNSLNEFQIFSLNESN